MAEIPPADQMPSRPLWLVLGDARPLVDQAVSRITADTLARCGLPAFNHGSWRSADANAREAIGIARTPPMMADLRLVVLRDLEEAPDDLVEELAVYAASPSPTTVLLVTGTSIPKARKGGKNGASRLAALVGERGKVLTFSQEDVSLPRFVREEAARHGKRLGEQESVALVEIVGGDLARLGLEVAKVALYVGDREEITEEDLHEACSLVALSVVWDLTTGIADRDPDKALAALHRQLEEGEDPRKLLGVIGWQMRLVLQAAEAARKGASSQEIRRAAGRMSFDAVRDLERAVKEGRAPTAASVLGRIAEANRQMNEHRAGDRRILERLVLDLCLGTP